MVLKRLFQLQLHQRSFENDVEMYGAQARSSQTHSMCVFENDVEMYGAQAIDDGVRIGHSLRMM